MSKILCISTKVAFMALVLIGLLNVEAVTAFNVNAAKNSWRRIHQNTILTRMIDADPQADSPSTERCPYPYGISSWEKVVTTKSFYIDKTKTIELMESPGFGEYVKVWRPRRSGKSLFCNQLALYYDTAVDDNKFRELFGHTYIGQHPTALRGSYLVFHLNFATVASEGDITANFRDYVNSAVLKFTTKYAHLLRKVKINDRNHLDSMTRMFNAIEATKNKIYAIIDEYDSFTNRLLFNVDTTGPDFGAVQYQKTVAGSEAMLRSFGNVLKQGTEGPIDKTFFTGVTPMAFSDGLSSLNMVLDVSAEPETETLFGFTTEEIKKALSLIYTPGSEDFEKHLDIMRTNFNGYRYSDLQRESVFNPQMCLYYLRELQRKGTTPRTLLDPSIGIAGDNVAQFLIKNYKGFDAYPSLSLILGVFDLKILPAFRSEDLFESNSINDALVSLAFFHGFLTYADPTGSNAGKLVASNRVFKEIFLQTLFRSISERSLKRFMDALDMNTVAGKKGALDELLKENTMNKAVDDIFERLINTAIRYEVGS